jgi:RNA-binding protein
MAQTGSMRDLQLTGAQKAFLRGVGQRTEPKLKIGKSGLNPGFYAHLQQMLRADELVKVRFLGADRDDNAALCATIADQGRCVCVGAVGRTALFYSQQADPKDRKVLFP